MRLPPFAASRPRSRDSMALLLGLAVALCGCSDDADDPTEPGPATHTFTVTLTNVSPRTGDLSAAVTLWDAGTEVDQWPGAAPRPACRRLPARLACGAMIIRDVPARSPIAPLLMVLAASLVACGGGGESPGADEGDDDAAEVNVFDFGRASGGGVGANLQRWIGQMEAAAGEQPTRGQFTADGMAGHVVALDGTDDVGARAPWAVRRRRARATGWWAWCSRGRRAACSSSSRVPRPPRAPWRPICWPWWRPPVAPARGLAGGTKYGIDLLCHAMSPGGDGSGSRRRPAVTGTSRVRR